MTPAAKAATAEEGPGAMGTTPPPGVGLGVGLGVGWGVGVGVAGVDIVAER